MKVIAGILIAVIIALVVGCASPESMINPTTPTPSAAPPSKSEEPYEATFHAWLDTWLQGTMVVNRPSGLVMIKNTDNIQRTFKVEITLYYGDKGFTKEFILHIEPGQVKTAVATSTDMYELYDIAPPGLTQEDSEIRQAFREAGGKEMYKTGNWGIDYKVTPQ